MSLSLHLLRCFNYMKHYDPMANEKFPCQSYSKLSTVPYFLLLLCPFFVFCTFTNTVYQFASTCIPANFLEGMIMLQQPLHHGVHIQKKLSQISQHFIYSPAGFIFQSPALVSPLNLPRTRQDTSISLSPSSSHVPCSMFINHTRNLAVGEIKMALPLNNLFINIEPRGELVCTTKDKHLAEAHKTVNIFMLQTVNQKSRQMFGRFGQGQLQNIAKVRAPFPKQKKLN